MKNPRLAYGLMVCWAVLAGATIPRAANAMGLAAEMAIYDVRSLGWAVLIALLGGALRTIYTLATDDRVVWDQLRESWRDAVISLLAGGAVYVAMEAGRAWFGIKLPFEVRFALLLVAGVARVRTFTWLTNVGGRIADMAADWLLGRVRLTLPPTADEPPKGTP